MFLAHRGRITVKVRMKGSYIPNNVTRNSVISSWVRIKSNHTSDQVRIYLFLGILEGNLQQLYFINPLNLSLLIFQNGKGRETIHSINFFLFFFFFLSLLYIILIVSLWNASQTHFIFECVHVLILFWLLMSSCVSVKNKAKICGQIIYGIKYVIQVEALKQIIAFVFFNFDLFTVWAINSLSLEKHGTSLNHVISILILFNWCDFYLVP